MSSLPAGWYKDPADTTTQRYWDGEGWIGKAIPADAVPPDGPPSAEEEEPPPAAPVVGAPPPWKQPQQAPPPHQAPRPIEQLLREHVRVARAERVNLAAAGEGIGHERGCRVEVGPLGGSQAVDEAARFGEIAAARGACPCHRHDTAFRQTWTSGM